MRNNNRKQLPIPPLVHVAYLRLGQSRSLIAESRPLRVLANTNSATILFAPPVTIAFWEQCSIGVTATAVAATIRDRGRPRRYSSAKPTPSHRST